MGETLEYHLLDFEESAVDCPDGVLEVGECAVLLAYALLPVPLVDVERVDIVEVLEGTDCVHVGV